MWRASSDVQAMHARQRIRRRGGSGDRRPGHPVEAASFDRVTAGIAVKRL
jgi:hypothetical protein